MKWKFSIEIDDEHIKSYYEELCIIQNSSRHKRGRHISMNFKTVLDQLNFVLSLSYQKSNVKHIYCKLTTKEVHTSLNWKQEFFLEAMSNPFLIIFTVVIVISCAKAKNFSEQCSEDCSFTAWECYDSK